MSSDPSGHPEAPSTTADPSRRRIPGGFRFGGVVAAVIAFWLSLTPTLLPRSGLFQGVLGGAAAAIAYGLTVAVLRLGRLLLRRPWPGPARLASWLALLAVAVLGTLAMLVYYASWEDELRRLMGVEALPKADYAVLLVVALVVFVLFVVAARLLRWVSRLVARLVSLVAPPRVSAVVGALVVVAVIVAFVNGWLLTAAQSSLDATFAAVNQETHADSVQPTSSELSGGPGSLMSWDSLGRQGRRFVASGPTTTELTTFSGRPATQPIRAYSGLASAPTVQAEADLAVRELERTGGFDRAVLGVVTTTGTGWVNENSADALEYLYNGDSALVGMQYSYLPSWISFIVDKDRAKAAGKALFDAVHARWATLPAATRPKLVVFGESLGSFGGEAAFSDVRALRDTTDGVLFVGPPSSNELWSDIVAHRDAGSPEWLPIYEDGRTVRFVARPENLARPAATWGSPRVVYLQYASDPIVWWSPDLLLSKPDWLAEPRGYDVLPSTRWVPVLTFLQVSADMAVSDGVPPGHGHRYGPDPADAWAAILQPAGWTAADTARLRAALLVRESARDAASG